MTFDEMKIELQSGVKKARLPHWILGVALQYKEEKFYIVTPHYQQEYKLYKSEIDATDWEVVGDL